MLIETSAQGEATVMFQMPASEGSIYYELKAEHQSFLEKLVPNNNCCDGIFLKVTGELVDIYLVELKTNLGVNTWDKVQKQFRGASLVALTFCSIVGLAVNSIQLYTAFLDDSPMYKEQTTEAMRMKVKGSYAKKPLLGRGVTTVKAWNEETISLFQRTGRIPHYKIQLTKDPHTFMNTAIYNA